MSLSRDALIIWGKRADQPGISTFVWVLPEGWRSTPTQIDAILERLVGEIGNIDADWSGWEWRSALRESPL